MVSTWHQVLQFEDVACHRFGGSKNIVMTTPGMIAVALSFVRFLGKSDGLISSTVDIERLLTFLKRLSRKR